ncbi:MAG: FAD-dependent oxidoreductase [Pseudomonadota bacterium]
MQLIAKGLVGLPEHSAFDVVVVGAGGAGLAAALYAAIDGAKVLLVEHSGFVGGTTAWSGGTTWIPGTRHGATVNPADTLADARLYLDKAVGPRSPAALRQAFLGNGPQAVEHIEANSEVRYRAYPRHPDYISDLPGSTVNGRALEPLPFDGRLLGDLFKLVRPPIPEFTVLGGMMVDRTDINHLLSLGSSPASLNYAVKLLARHAVDRISHPRGTRLVMGNALVGRLLYSLSLRNNVTLAINTSVEQIRQGANGVGSVTLLNKEQRQTVQVKGGLILASGGFNRHPQLRKQLLPGTDIAWCPAAPGHTGQAHELVQKLGGHYGSEALSPAFWAPISTRKRKDGSQAVFPHFMMDRAKPGMLTVNQAGERFVNESTSYHLFGLKMQELNQTTPTIPAYLVCDANALRRYGLGMVRPGGKRLGPFLADGYLTEAASIEELASKLGIQAAGLVASVKKLNSYAESGVDADFQRGATAYQQNMGDATRGGKNPNLGALTQAPFYAVRLYPGDIGAATGFETTADACVLNARQQPVGGLYAVGNDMHSIMGGTYPAPGITLGPGLVFAYLAARHAVARGKTSLA